MFDPLGWVSPSLVKAKHLLQKVTNPKSKWDTVLEPSVKDEWDKIVASLKGINKVSLPRYISNNGKREIVVFCDASTISFAAAVYLRATTDTRIDCNLVMSKSRLLPTKGLTIPRAELMAIVLGNRLGEFVCHQLDIDQGSVTLISDSKCALAWLHSDGNKQDVFVRNRVLEVYRRLPKMTCRYTPTDENPADWATRGKLPQELTDFWFRGPPWLRKEVNQWPKSDVEPFQPRVPESKEKIGT